MVSNLSDSYTQWALLLVNAAKSIEFYTKLLPTRSLEERQRHDQTWQEETISRWLRKRIIETHCLWYFRRDVATDSAADVWCNLEAEQVKHDWRN